MKLDEIRAKVYQLAADQIGETSDMCHDDLHIVDDLRFDSIDCVELTMELEDEFDIAITDDQAESCKTLGDITKLCIKLTGTFNKEAGA